MLAVRYNEQYRDIDMKQRQVSFNSQEILYFLKLRKMLGFPPKSVDKISMKDMLRVLCKLNIRANHYEGIADSTEILSDENTYQKQFPISLSEQTLNIQLPEIRNYQYEIVNNGKETVVGPVLYQKHLWDTAQNLISSAGFDSIENELDRAKALWRFVAENRYHFAPVTEGYEEHDIIKYLSVYGYGYCDDTARILSKLADMTGLKARIWGIGGGRHVVSEIYANGKWIMFDADRNICFHNKKSGKLYGVEELSKIRNLSQENIGFYENRQKDYLEIGEIIDLYTNGEKCVLEASTVARGEHEIRYYLRAGEKIAFMNHNVGKYFLGKYPQNVPEYYTRIL